MLIKTTNSYGKDNNEGIQPSSMKKDGKLHARNVSITKENNLISNWLKDYGDPAIDKLAKRNLAVAFFYCNSSRLGGALITAWLVSVLSSSASASKISRVDCCLIISPLWIGPSESGRMETGVRRMSGFLLSGADVWT